MSDLPVGQRRQILQQKITYYQQAYYAHQVDAQVGQDIGDTRMVESAKDNMRKVRQVLDRLEKMIQELA